MLDVICLCASRNLVPMAALTKEQPRPSDKNNNIDTVLKQTEFTKAWKNGYQSRQQLPPSLSRHRKPEIKNRKRFKRENRCPNDHHKERCSRSKEDAGQKSQDPPPIMKYDRKINTSYTPFTLIVHVLIILQHLYTLYVTPSTSISSMRLASFTQLVYVTTTCFHIATLLANIFKKTQLERAFVLYGTWVIWIGWAMCLWLIRPENRPDPVLYRFPTTPTDGIYNNDDGHYYINHDGPVDMFDLEYLLAPMNVAPFLMHGKWSSTTLPIISFFLLLVIRRNHWGLIIWEYLVLLDYSRTLKWYRAWCVAGASAGWMLTWEAAKFWLKIPLSYSEGHVRYKTDLPTFPGLFNVLLVSFMAGTFMICWWNFWTFQYRGVIWKKEFKEGVVLWSSDGSMRVGGIGC